MPATHAALAWVRVIAPSWSIAYSEIESLAALASMPLIETDDTRLAAVDAAEVSASRHTSPERERHGEPG